ncbi:MAG: two-component system sensor histidine kinase NtrB, partial [Stellaceae bacterium]
MPSTKLAPLRGSLTTPAETAAILAALPDPVLVVDAGNRMRYANAAAEQFFETSAANLAATALGDLLPLDSPLFALIEQVRRSGHSVSEFGVTLETPRLGSRSVTIQAAPIAEERDRVVVTLQERSIAAKLDRQLTHRNAARSVTAMAAMLAHEVKNPLSGIRGAAQLIEQTASAADRELTRLICDETDRICALVDRMDAFSERSPIEREPVNIHEVLERVRKVAASGFARQVRFSEIYDPSLPSVDGNRDLLIQAFLY